MSAVRVLKVAPNLRVDRELTEYYLLDLTRFITKSEFYNAMCLYPWQAVVPSEERGVFKCSFEAGDLGGLLAKILYADGQVGETCIRRTVEGQFEVTIARVQLTEEQYDARKRVQSWLSRLNLLGIFPYPVSVVPTSMVWSIVSVKNLLLWDMMSHRF